MVCDGVNQSSSLMSGANAECNLRVLSVFAGISAAAGVLIPFSDLPFRWSGWIFLLGLTHAVVFVPAMIMSRTPVWKMVVATIVCLLFPIWGFMGVVLVASIGSPFVCSLLWGFVVSWAVRRPIAIVFFAIAGVLSNAGMIVAMEMRIGNSSDWGLPQSIGLWHLLMFPTYCWMMSWSPRPLIGGPIDYSVCQQCSYPIAGLPEGAPCPECGSAFLQET